MVAVAVAVAPSRLEAIAVPCWNPLCVTRNGERHTLTRVHVDGDATVTVFQKCGFCYRFNIRVIRNGVVVD